MQPYFVRNEQDRLFYDEFLGPRLPKQIYDIHVHQNLLKHVRMVPE